MPIVTTSSRLGPEARLVRPFERREYRDSSVTSGELGGGDRRKARILARGIGRAADDVGGEVAAEASVPRQPRSAPASFSVTNTPEACGNAKDGRAGSVRLATRAVTDRRARSSR